MGFNALQDMLRYEEAQRIRQATQEAKQQQAAKLAQLLATNQGLEIGNRQQGLKADQMAFLAPQERWQSRVEALGPNTGTNATIAAEPGWATQQFQPSAIPMRHSAPLAAELQPKTPWDVSGITNPPIPGQPVQGDIQGTLPEVARKAASQFYNMGMDNQRKVGLEAGTYPFKRDFEQLQSEGAMARVKEQNKSQEKIAAGHDIAYGERDKKASISATIKDITTKSMLQGGQLQPLIDKSYELMAKDKSTFKEVGAEGSGRLEAYQSQLQALSSGITRYSMAMQSAQESAIAEGMDPTLATKAYREMLLQAQSTYAELKKRHDAEMEALTRSKTRSPWNLPQLGSDVGP
jgi:hypothetical protein